MCDHTPAERGGPLDARLPIIPTVGNIFHDQKARCASCGERVAHVQITVPVAVKIGDVMIIKLVCPPCHHGVK